MKEKILNEVKSCLDNKVLGEPVMFFGFYLSKTSTNPVPNGFGIVKDSSRLRDGFLVPTVMCFGDFSVNQKHELQKAVQILDTLTRGTAKDLNAKN